MAVVAHICVSAGGGGVPLRDGVRRHRACPRAVERRRGTRGLDRVDHARRGVGTLAVAYGTPLSAVWRTLLSRSWQEGLVATCRKPRQLPVPPLRLLSRQLRQFQPRVGQPLLRRKF